MELFFNDNISLGRFLLTSLYSEDFILEKEGALSPLSTE